MKRLLPVVGVVLLAAACGGGVTAPDAPSEMKNPADTANAYPTGPYGYVQGTVIDDLQLIGQRDEDGNKTPTNDPIRLIKLSDFYKKKDQVKVVVVMVAAGWCNPCKAEQAGLIDIYNQYKAANAGVEFVEAIIQDANFKPADMTFVDNWANRKWTATPPFTGLNGKVIPFAMAADPTVALGPYYDVAAFPMQMIIRTSDMTIQWQNNGLANDQLRNQIDAALGN